MLHFITGTKKKINTQKPTTTKTPTCSKLGNFEVYFLPPLPATLSFLILTTAAARHSTGISKEGPQNVPMKGQRGMTKEVKLQEEHNPKKTFSLETGQADVLAADKGLRKQVTVP